MPLAGSRTRPKKVKPHRVGRVKCDGSKPISLCTLISLGVRHWARVKAFRPLSPRITTVPHRSLLDYSHYNRLAEPSGAFFSICATVGCLRYPWVSPRLLHKSSRQTLQKADWSLFTPFLPYAFLHPILTRLGICIALSTCV